MSTTAAQAITQPAARMPASDPRWRQGRYVVKERRLTLGRQYRVFDEAGQLVAYCKQKMFRLREDIRFYTDESQQHELFQMRATKVLDWAGNFEVIESASQSRLGVIRRKMWKSVLRDEWHVFNGWEQPWAVLKEDTTGIALWRRFLSLFNLDWLVPMEYRLHRDGADESQPVATIRERVQLFGDTYDLTLRPDAGMDARVLLSLTIGIDAIEGE